MGLVAGTLALGGGAWGVKEWAPFADAANASPTWPENVQPIVEYVERLTGLQFRSQIEVEYIEDDDEYAERVLGEPFVPTADDIASAADDDAAGRAMGLWAGDVSILESNAAYNSSEPFPASWLIDENTIVINAVDGDDSLTPFARAELALLLTQALDHQLFGTVERIDQAPSPQNYQAAVAVAAGHAIWVQDEYIADLSGPETTRYENAYQDRVDSFVEETSNVPGSYLALRSAGQQLGTTFIVALAETDPSQIEAAFTSKRPTSLDQISLPFAKYERFDPTEPIEPPAAPRDATRLYSGQLGPTGTYLLLTTGMPSTEALTASDGWGNDSYTVYRLDDTVCVDLHLIADSPDDADRLFNGLNGWAAVRPPAAKALIGRDGTDLYATVCDPGTKARQPVPTTVDVDQFYVRSSYLGEQIDDTGNPELAECIAVTTFEQYTLTELRAPDFDGEIADALQTLEDDCRDQVG
ncbi:MAG: hypothetical protein ABMA25_18415 [Ilumatobacteraceae bacterium]